MEFIEQYRQLEDEPAYVYANRKYRLLQSISISDESLIVIHILAGMLPRYRAAITSIPVDFPSLLTTACNLDISTKFCRYCKKKGHFIEDCETLKRKRIKNDQQTHSRRTIEERIQQNNNIRTIIQ